MQVVVWRRHEFRESSRLVTLLSRERGRFLVLAKGAFRPGSAHLGRLDFLNRCEVELAGRGIPLLGRTRLCHEPRALREPIRFLVAAHLCELFDAAFQPDKPDAELFDLLLGTIALVEHTPPAHLPIVVLGVELRLLAVLGLLGRLDRCSTCGGASARYWLAGEPGLTCARDRAIAARGLSAAAIGWLDDLAASPAARWADRSPARGLGEALRSTRAWVEHALELRARHRSAALRACAG